MITIKDTARAVAVAGSTVAPLQVVPTTIEDDPARGSLALLHRISHVQFMRRSRALRAPWFGIDDAAFQWRRTRFHLRASSVEARQRDGLRARANGSPHGCWSELWYE